MQGNNSSSSTIYCYRIWVIIKQPLGGSFYWIFLISKFSMPFLKNSSRYFSSKGNSFSILSSKLILLIASFPYSLIKSRRVSRKINSSQKTSLSYSSTNFCNSSSNSLVGKNSWNFSSNSTYFSNPKSLAKEKIYCSISSNSLICSSPFLPEWMA